MLRIRSRHIPILVYQSLGLQLGLVLAVSALFWLRNSTTAVAVLWGGAVYGIPNLIFALIFFRRVKPGDSGRIISTFYWGELVKFILMGLLFVAVLKKEASIDPIGVIIGFLTALCAVWLVPLLTQRN